MTMIDPLVWLGFYRDQRAISKVVLDLRLALNLYQQDHLFSNSANLVPADLPYTAPILRVINHVTLDTTDDLISALQILHDLILTSPLATGYPLADRERSLLLVAYGDLCRFLPASALSMPAPSLRHP